jgi:hypothetical protein
VHINDLCLKNLSPINAHQKASSDQW